MPVDVPVDSLVPREYETPVVSLDVRPTVVLAFSPSVSLSDVPSVSVSLSVSDTVGTRISPSPIISERYFAVVISLMPKNCLIHLKTYGKLVLILVLIVKILQRLIGLSKLNVVSVLRKWVLMAV